MILLRCLLALLFLALAAADPGFPQCAPGLARPINAPLREYRGAYENRAYGYAFTIPDGLVGRDEASPDYQRGLVLLLADEPARA